VVAYGLEAGHLLPRRATAGGLIAHGPTSSEGRGEAETGGDRGKGFGAVSDTDVHVR
jgi:hypothetical protein